MLFVTGITGHTGRFFLERLIKENYLGEIKCLVRVNSDTTLLDNSGLNIEKVYGDLKDKELLNSSLAGMKIVLNISGIIYSKEVMDAAIINGVEWSIMVHTTGRYSKYKSASAEYIKIEENILNKRDKIGITILRPTMIYGSSNDRNIYRLINFLFKFKFFPIFGNGRNLMQPVHARDLGNAYYDVIMNKGRTYNNEYNLSGKQAIEYIELVKCVSRNLGKNNILVKIPLSLSIGGTKLYQMISKKPLVSVEQVLRIQEDKVFDFENATNDFQYSPVAFEEGIVEEVQEYMNAKELK